MKSKRQDLLVKIIIITTKVRHIYAFSPTLLQNIFAPLGNVESINMMHGNT